MHRYANVRFGRAFDGWLRRSHRGGGGNTSGLVSINTGGAAAGAFVADTDLSGGSTTSTSAANQLSPYSDPSSPPAVYLTGRTGGRRNSYPLPSISKLWRSALLPFPASTVSLFPV